MSDRHDSYPWQPIPHREECCVRAPFFEVDNLSLSYHGKPAFRGISMAISKGCIMSLVGPSGCGKTSFLTTLNRMCDLIPGCTVTGQVKIGGIDIFQDKSHVTRLRQRVGMIFQRPNPFPLSIRRNLEFPLREYGTRSARDLARTVEETLTDVGLWNEVKDRLDKSALSLSGGQQQRLCIARALCLKPEALLMDEPCSALDPHSSATIEALITTLKGKYTIVIVTHNLAQARRIADDTAFFWHQDGAGQLFEFGPSRQLFTQPRHELTAAYIAGVQG